MKILASINVLSLNIDNKTNLAWICEGWAKFPVTLVVTIKGAVKQSECDGVLLQ